MRMIGTKALGIRTPLIKNGDDLTKIVVEAILDTCKYENVKLKNKDIIGITESLVARSQMNFINIDEVTKEIDALFKGEIGVVFPILSRNRFSLILKAIANTNKKVHLFLTYPNDEVGNPIMDEEVLKEHKINPYTHTITEEEYKKLNNGYTHPFTKLNYVDMYKSINPDNITIYLSNDPCEILNYTKDVLVANVHDREKTKALLKECGAELIIGLDDLVNEKNENCGYNEKYGLLGSNMASETSLKLFPRDCKKYANEIKKELFEKTNIEVEVLIYGDGAFKDPIAKIWELADPVVSPGYTDGLEGTPNEVKLKYIVDNSAQLTQNELKEEIRKKMLTKENNNSLGTTPRKITDLLGSLCDLTSGSGDKGTPVVLIQGYFDNYCDN